MAETLDTQLKQMSEDLKEIIEHLNESNKLQEMSNPVRFKFFYIILLLKLHISVMFLDYTNWKDIKRSHEFAAMD